MAKRSSTTLKIRNRLMNKQKSLEELEKDLFKGGSKIGITKSSKSKSKRNLKIEKLSRRINRGK